MRILLILVLVLALLWGVKEYMQWTPKITGVVNGQLRDCPSSPNCVCSQANAETHRVSAIHYTGQSNPIPTIARVVLGLPRVTLLEEDQHYLHFMFRTKLMRYIDDVEFLWIPSENLIHIRSASRIGHSDMGANRARVELIKNALRKHSERDFR